MRTRCGRVDRLAIGQPKFQSAAQVDQVDDQRDPGLQPYRYGLAVEGISQPEHFFHGQFVGEADQVMDGPAALRGEGRGLGIGQ